MATIRAEARKQTFNHSNTLPLIQSRRSTGLWGDDEEPWLTRIPKRVVSLTWIVLTSNVINVLLIFVPIGIVGGYLKLPPLFVFITNFGAIIPLASLLAWATEQMAAKCGDTIGGLLNNSLGNVVEVVVSLVALKEGQIRVVQASVLGSILSNMLLVLGCCFIAGGWQKPGHGTAFSSGAASMMANLLVVSASCLMIPAAFKYSLSASVQVEDAVLLLSRGVSVLMLIFYGFYLWFQLWFPDLFETLKEEEPIALEADGTQTAEEEPKLNPLPASILLVVLTLITAVCAEYLVGSIDHVVESTPMTRTFIGIILIPIVGNAAEHVTAIIVAKKGKMDLALAVAIGSSIQIALFVTPLVVLAGIFFGQPMTLFFQLLEVVSFFIATLVVNSLIQDGSSNLLEGVLCVGMYIIIAFAFFVYPEAAEAPILGTIKGLFVS